MWVMSYNPILFEASDWWKASNCGTKPLRFANIEQCQNWLVFRILLFSLSCIAANVFTALKLIAFVQPDTTRRTSGRLMQELNVFTVYQSVAISW